MAVARGKEQGIKREYAMWCALDKRQRRTAGLPTTQKEFAEKHHVNARTLNRWSKEEEFQQLVADFRPAEAPEEPAPTPDTKPDVALDDYREVREALVDKAKTGDRQAMDLYMKHYGKPFIEEEHAERTSSFQEFSDEALVAAVVDAAGSDLVERVLYQRAGRSDS